MDKNKKSNKIKAYTKYSGLAYQLFGMLGVTLFLGLKVDKYFGNEKQIITACAMLFVVFAFLYKLIIQLDRK